MLARSSLFLDLSTTSKATGSLPTLVLSNDRTRWLHRTSSTSRSISTSPRAAPYHRIPQTSQRIPVAQARVHFSTTRFKMAKEYKLGGIASLSEVKLGKMQEVEIEGIEGGKVLLANVGGKVHAVGPKCTHYGAPLKNGVLSSDGRVTCPWHGACFSVTTGDVEDAPALDPIAKFEISEKDGAVFVSGAEQDVLKAGRHQPRIACSPQGGDKVVIVGGGSGATGAMEQLRTSNFKGHITVIAAEHTLPYDRPKLSKGLVDDASKITWRSADFYKSAGIDMVFDEATGVDFSAKSVSTKAGKSFPYTKLILATGGTPRSLPLPGLKAGELQNVFLLRTVSDVAKILKPLGNTEGKQVVVIGSSFIGMEVGNALAGKKHKVSIIGMEEEPCQAVFGAKLGAVFRGMLEKSGVKFYMSAQVSHATPSSSDSSLAGAVHLKDGTQLPADIVIEGVGVGPATTFLKDSPGAPALEKDGSLTVDEHFAVKGLQDVYAIGDIATYPYKGQNVRIEHWNVASNAGRAVAKHIVDPSAKQRPFVPVFWSALGAQLRYCGNIGKSGYDDVVIQGELDVAKGPAFAAYYTKGDDVVAVATMGKDPVMVQCAQLLRDDKMLKKSDLESGKDVMSLTL